jgi:hypothetical protein
LQHLVGDFPDQIETILKLRISDPIFEGICVDYEEIATEKTRIISRGDNPPLPSLGDLTHTLEALRVEINRYLKHENP